MKDITAALRVVLDAPSQKDINTQLLRQLATGINGALDWDEGAGEAGGRVLVGPDVAAAVHMRSGVVIARSETIEVAQATTSSTSVIEVQDFETPTLRADRSTLESFVGRTLDPIIDPASFSASELWYISI